MTQSIFETQGDNTKRPPDDNVAGYDVGFDELVSPAIAAKIAGISPRSLRAWIPTAR